MYLCHVEHRNSMGGKSSTASCWQLLAARYRSACVGISDRVLTYNMFVSCSVASMQGNCTVHACVFALQHTSTTCFWHIGIEKYHFTTYSWHTELRKCHFTTCLWHKGPFTTYLWRIGNQKCHVTVKFWHIGLWKCHCTTCWWYIGIRKYRFTTD